LPSRSRLARPALRRVRNRISSVIMPG
jgi:hypothetical protein